VKHLLEVSNQTPIIWYLSLRAVDEFQMKRARWPGTQDSQLNTDVDEVFMLLRNLALSMHVCENLIETAADAPPIMQMDTSSDNVGPLITRAHAEEIVRYGGAELHTISALIGGIAAQEIVKLLTNQFVPLNNTYVFNGIASVGATYML
jgi:NEDD8-activating enzyme E1 regulatory subunit